jgi:uncharacterized membrane protein
MATTKSTVVGIRLDHDRRAWVEAEAARLGVSVRGLFEGMIDEARSEETMDAAPSSTEPAPAREDVASMAAPSVATATSTDEPIISAVPGSVNADAATAGRQTPAGQSPLGFGLVTGIPCGMIRGAFSLTANVIEAGGRCATNRLGGCALTRRWVSRSL